MVLWVEWRNFNENCQSPVLSLKLCWDSTPLAKKHQYHWPYHANQWMGAQFSTLHVCSINILILAKNCWVLLCITTNLLQAVFKQCNKGAGLCSALPFVQHQDSLPQSLVLRTLGRAPWAAGSHSKALWGRGTAGDPGSLHSFEQQLVWPLRAGDAWELQSTRVWQSKCISAFCNPPPGCAVSPHCHQGSARGEHLLEGAGVLMLSYSERLEFESVFLLHTSPTFFHTRNISYDLQIPVVLLQIKKKSLSKNTQIIVLMLSALLISFSMMITGQNRKLKLNDCKIWLLFPFPLWNRQ